MGKNFDIKSYQINDFLEWHDKNQLILSPKFQRRRVWSQKAKSYFIDSILRGLPIPPVFIRQIIDINTRKTKREVIDGQQRLATILDYINDGFKVSKNHNETYYGKLYSELPVKVREEIIEYEIPVNVITSQNDEDALRIFARLNTYTVMLNEPEKLNAEYFGFFKQVVHDLAYEFNKFWLNSNILNENKIARMQDVDLTSELVISGIDGIQDRNRIKHYYENYEDIFANRIKIKKNFEICIDTIGEVYGDLIKDSCFNGIPFFYSLYNVFYDLLFSLPKSKHKTKLKTSDFPKLKNALQNLEEIISPYLGDANDAPSELRKFIIALRTHSTVLKERNIRHEYIMNYVKKFL